MKIYFKISDGKFECELENIDMVSVQAMVCDIVTKLAGRNVIVEKCITNPEAQKVAYATILKGFSDFMEIIDTDELDRIYEESKKEGNIILNNDEEKDMLADFLSFLVQTVDKIDEMNNLKDENEFTDEIETDKEEDDYEIDL